MKKLSVFVAALMMAITCSFNSLKAQLTPQDAIIQMGRGINLGNTLEPPEGEGKWNNPVAEEYYFDDYKAAGFTCVRIPITWQNHASTTSPYTINEAWLDRVEQIVDWGLSRKLFIIINAHHEGWLKKAVPVQADLDRFDSIWSQIATRFKDKSDSLIFEMLNEPNPMPKASVDALNARVLAIIRKTNPTRIVSYSGNLYSNSAELMAAAIPDDDYLIGYYHSYDPWSFAGEAKGTWGTTSDRNSLKSAMDGIKAWSVLHNIPVNLGEFGAQKLCDYNSRMKHYAAYVEECISHGFAFEAWDDGGDFAIYQRQARKWNEIKDIVINDGWENPTNLKAENQNGLSVSLTWTNRTTSNDSIIVLRGTLPTAMSKIAFLAADASEYSDEAIEQNKKYYYKVTALFKDTTDLMSYPVVVSTTHISSVSSVGTDKAVLVFPNPVLDELTVKLKNDIITQLELYNYVGQVLKVYSPQKSEIKIPTQELSNGIYFLTIETQGSSYVEQFVKE